MSNEEYDREGAAQRVRIKRAARIHKPEGYRYVRQYRVRDVARWALWEVRGGRKVRVGTALTEADWRRYLGVPPEASKR